MPAAEGLGPPALPPVAVGGRPLALTGRSRGPMRVNDRCVGESVCASEVTASSCHPESSAPHIITLYTD
ncbi:unnamed protein product [Haemonchus placei]|uniref:Uncharacterized protein n=1 Tax=Haemonchus placei TaxID=6290 RepID=A0A0N4WA22_HAEPC|nr:unnamed protein product [Haemonchus placei]